MDQGEVARVAFGKPLAGEEDTFDALLIQYRYLRMCETENLSSGVGWLSLNK
jgi:hypothetical protein